MGVSQKNLTEHILSIYVSIYEQEKHGTILNYWQLTIYGQICQTVNCHTYGKLPVQFVHLLLNFKHLLKVSHVLTGSLEIVFILHLIFAILTFVNVSRQAFPFRLCRPKKWARSLSSTREDATAARLDGKSGRRKCWQVSHGVDCRAVRGLQIMTL